MIKNCRQCGKSFETKTRKVFCSDTCFKISENNRSKRRSKERSESRKCKICFGPVKKHKIFCASCYKIRRDIKQKEEYKKCYKRKRKLVVDYKLKRGCQKCGYKKCAGALEFHHKNKNDKEKRVSKMITSCTKEKILTEIKKCIVLCANCHREIHCQ
jgi:hypothetical protein